MQSLTGVEHTQSSVTFFCHGCLIDKSVIEMSPDPRYCLECYGFLLKEAEILSPGKRPAWIPKAQAKEMLNYGHNNPRNPTINCSETSSAGKNSKQKLIQASQDVILNMSTSEPTKNTVDIIKPSVNKVTYGKRGPKRRQLPEDLIRKLAVEGVGSKAITARLRLEYGIHISYKTIQRVLSGERNVRNVLPLRLND